MIFKHKRTGKYYRTLCESFDVETQQSHTVYVQLDTGFIFNRNSEVFEKNFELVNVTPQLDIIPNDPKRK